METEITLKNSHVCEAIAVLDHEVRMRVLHGDAAIEGLQKVIEALEKADRIVIK